MNTRTCNHCLDLLKAKLDGRGRREAHARQVTAVLHRHGTDDNY